MGFGKPHFRKLVKFEVVVNRLMAVKVISRTDYRMAIEKSRDTGVLVVSITSLH